MTWSAGSISGSLVMQTAKYNAALDEAVAHTQRSATALKETAERAGHDTAEGLIHSLKHQTGRRSVFGESLEILAGGGAVMAISMAAEQLDKMADKIGELDEMTRKGGYAWTDYAEKMLSTVPVLGTVFSAMEKMGKVITGVAEEERLAAEEKAAWSETQKVSEDLRWKAMREGEHHDDVMSNLSWQPRLDAARGAQREALEIEKEAEDKIREISRGMGVHSLDRGEQEELKKAEAALRQMAGREPVHFTNQYQYDKWRSDKRDEYSYDPISGTPYLSQKVKTREQFDDEWRNWDRLRQPVQAKIDELKNSIKHHDAEANDEIAGINAGKGDRIAALLTRYTQQTREGFNRQVQEMGLDPWEKLKHELEHPLTGELKLKADDLKKAEEDINRLKAHSLDVQLDDLTRRVAKAGLSPLDQMRYDLMNVPMGQPRMDTSHFEKMLGQLHEYQQTLAALNIENMQRELAETSMNPFQKRRFELANPLSNEDKKSPLETNRLMDLLDKMESKSILEGIETPIEKLARALEDAKRLLGEGLITPKQFDRFKAMQQNSIFGQEKLPTAIRSGSYESMAAQQAELNAKRGMADHSAEGQQLTALNEIGTKLDTVNNLLRDKRLLAIADGVT